MIGHGLQQNEAWKHTERSLKYANKPPEEASSEGSIVVVVWPKFSWNQWFNDRNEGYGSWQELENLIQTRLEALRGPAVAFPSYFVLLDIKDSLGGKGHRHNIGPNNDCQYKDRGNPGVPDPPNHLACEYDDVFQSELAVQFTDSGHEVRMVSGDRNVLKSKQERLETEGWQRAANVTFRAELLAFRPEAVRDGSNSEDRWSSIAAQMARQRAMDRLRQAFLENQREAARLAAQQEAERLAAEQAAQQLAAQLQAQSLAAQREAARPAPSPNAYVPPHRRNENSSS